MHIIPHLTAVLVFFWGVSNLESNLTSFYITVQIEKLEVKFQACIIMCAMGCYGYAAMLILSIATAISWGITTGDTTKTSMSKSMRSIGYLWALALGANGKRNPTRTCYDIIFRKIKSTGEGWGLLKVGGWSSNDRFTLLYRSLELPPSAGIEEQELLPLLQKDDSAPSCKVLHHCSEKGLGLTRLGFLTCTAAERCSKVLLIEPTVSELLTCGKNNPGSQNEIGWPSQGPKRASSGFKH